jgi:hypothetical protein
MLPALEFQISYISFPYKLGNRILLHTMERLFYDFSLQTFQPWGLVV